MSSAAAMTSVGALSAASRSRASWSTSAAVWAANAAAGWVLSSASAISSATRSGRLGVEPRAEDPGRLRAHHHRHARGLGHLGPGLERRAGKRVGGGERVGQHQGAEVRRVGERVLLGDDAAHRHPGQVEAVQPGGAHHRVQVGGHLGAGVGAGRLAGPAHAAVVEADHAQARGQERVELVGPPLQRVADPVDQDQGVGSWVLINRPVDLVVQVGVAGAGQAGGHDRPRSARARSAKHGATPRPRRAGR